MEPIFTTHLFPEIDRKLIALLQSLSPEDWQKQTISPLWKIHDVALHLLDGNIRTLSMLRDNYFGVKAEGVSDYQDLVAFLNRLNSDWIIALRRLSPVLLIDLLEYTGRQYAEFLAGLDPFAPAGFSVAWAGEAESANWFHTAREYTEKWHHQQQIRLAVNQEDELLVRKFYFPFLETSMRALPHHYRDVQGKIGEVIRFDIGGEAGGSWFLQFAQNRWELIPEASVEPICTVSIHEKIAWRIFTKGISKAEASKFTEVKGRQDLGEKILDMLAIMA